MPQSWFDQFNTTSTPTTTPTPTTPSGSWFDQFGGNTPTAAPAVPAKRGVAVTPPKVRPKPVLPVETWYQKLGGIGKTMLETGGLDPVAAARKMVADQTFRRAIDPNDVNMYTRSADTLQGAAEGAYGMGKSMLQTGGLDPIAAAKKMAYDQSVQYALDPRNTPGMGSVTRHTLESAGIPAGNLMEDWETGNWGAGAADLATAGLGIYGLHQTVGAFRAPRPVARPTVVPPVEPVTPPFSENSVQYPSNAGPGNYPQLTEIAGADPSVKRVTVSRVPNPPTPRLTEVAGAAPDIRRVSDTPPPTQLQLPGRFKPRALLNPAPPVEPPTSMVSHPTGKTGLVADVDMPESLRSLDLQKPGHTSTDFELRPGAYGNLEAPLVEPWDFNKEPVKAPPEPYSQPRSQGITKDKGLPYSIQASAERPVPVRITKAGKVRVKDGQFYQTGGKEVFISEDLAEMIRRGKISPKLVKGDYLADQTLASVPDRLKPEVPNVTRLRQGAEGVPKAGARVPRETIEAGTGGNWAGEPETITVKGGPAGTTATRNKGAKLALSAEPDLPSAPLKGPASRLAKTVEEPIAKPGFKSGEGTIDPNKIDVINRKKGGINYKAYEGPAKGEPVHTKAYSEWLDKMGEGAAKFLEKNPEASAKEIKAAARKYAGQEPFERFEPEGPKTKTNRGDIDPGNVTEFPEKGGVAFKEHVPETEPTHFTSGRDVIEDTNLADKVYQDREFPQTKKLKNPNKEELKAWREKGYRVIDKQADGTTTISKGGEKPANIKARQAAEKASRTAEKLIAEKLRKNPEAAKDPTFMNAVRAIPERIRKSALYTELIRPLGVSGFRKLRTLGEAGNELADLMGEERSESAVYGGSHEVKTAQVARTLNKAERLELIDVMSGEKPLSSVTNQKILDGYKILRASTEELGNKAVEKNVRMKGRSGENVPFQKHSGEYFPQYYPEELYKNPELLREALNNSGKYSSAAIDAIVKQVTEKGERFSPSQHARTLNIPGWKKELSSLAKYQRDMAKAITRAEKYGPMDVADPNSRINQLIEKTNNPTEARKIVNDWLGRTETKGGRKLYQAAVKAQVATKLSQYLVTQIGDYGPMAGGLGIRNVLKGMKDVLKNPTGAHDTAMASGAHDMLISEFADEANGGGFGKAYGMNASEKLNRTVTAMAARYNIKELFQRAKNDPKSAPVLQRFVKGDVADVLKQSELTPEQIDFGVRRGVELSTGVPDKLTLSKSFHPDTPILGFPSLFKRYSYTTVRNMLDAIKTEPTAFAKSKKLLKIFAAYQATGEITGDVKAAIRGLINGDVEKTIEERGDWVGTGSPFLDRLVSNATQSAMLGLFGDVIEQGARGRMSVASNFMGGPIIGDLDELIAGGISAYQGDMKPLQKGAIRRIPVIGPGLTDVMFKDKPKSPFHFSNSAPNPPGPSRTR